MQFPSGLNFGAAFSMPLRSDLSITVSVVSHGQGRLVEAFLSDLARDGLDSSYQVILTLNIPEAEDFLRRYSSLPVTLVRNRAPKGFGANHNAAFAKSESRYFAVVNPDIRIARFSLQPIIETVGRDRAGVCGPAVFSNEGVPEDCARQFPTIRSLAAKLISGKASGAYRWGSEPLEVDWIAGMFMVFPRESFAAVGGFDERYFMYYEDVDICRRLRRAGWSIWLDPRTAVVHDAQRRSRRDMRHLRWHIASALRFLVTR